VAGPAIYGEALAPVDGGRAATSMTLMIWVLVIFMIVPEGFDYASLGSPSPTAGSLFSRLIWLGLLGGGAAVVIRQAPLARVLLGQLNPFLVAFVGLAFASVLWSIEPEFTLRRMIRVSTILLDALALALVSWHPQRLQSVLRPILTVMLIGSIVFVLAFPALGIERSTSFELAGAWHGLATQKNGLGSLAAITTLLWLHAWLAREARAPAILIGITVSLVCLYFSRSSTSLMATLFAAPVMAFLVRSPPVLRRYLPYMVGIFAVALLLYSLAVLRLVPGLEFLLRPVVMLTGKDQTFSGRTAIWDLITEHIGQSPLLGSGYGAYWIGPILGSPSYDYVMRLFFYPTEAHNGYLDIINDLGAIGGLCLLGYLLVYLRQSLRLFALQRAQGALYLSLLFEQLIANLSESRWLNVLCLEFVIMTLATVAMARGLLEARLRSHFGNHALRPGTARGAATGP
jgi:exopolysaccharide production protein ExoQ